MKKFIVIIVMLLSGIVANAQYFIYDPIFGIRKSEVKDAVSSEPVSDTLFLFKGLYSWTKTEKVKTGYYIGDEPVFKEKTTHGSNYSEIGDWFSASYKHIDVYYSYDSCKPFSQESKGTKYHFDSYHMIEVLINRLGGKSVTVSCKKDDAMIDSLRIVKKQFIQYSPYAMIIVGTNEIVSEEYCDDEEEPIPFQLVERKPSFNGGDANEFSKWVKETLKLPNNLTGKVRVTTSFVIDKNGKLINPKILYGNSVYYNSKAINLLNMSPKWVAGQQNGKPVNTQYTFPIIFE